MVAPETTCRSTIPRHNSCWPPHSLGSSRGVSPPRCPRNVKSTCTEVKAPPLRSGVSTYSTRAGAAKAAHANTPASMSHRNDFSMCPSPVGHGTFSEMKRRCGELFPLVEFCDDQRLDGVERFFRIRTIGLDFDVAAQPRAQHHQIHQRGCV